MAQKRMFSLSVVDTDWFLDLPLSTQALYFHLNMRADDDGFVDAPNAIVRKIGASKNDFDLLIAKRYVLQFESGIIVIKHWRMHNTLKNDRYVPTQFQEEFKKLEMKDNKAYTENKCFQSGTIMEPTCFQSDSTDIDIDKDIDKDIYILSNDNISPEVSSKPSEHAFISLILNNNSYFNVYNNMVEKYKKLYPAVDVEQELRNMCGWLDSNPSNRKTKNGIKSFITRWLNKKQDQASKKGVVANQPVDKYGGFDKL